MQYASLVVAICGLVLACLSLGWQAANYVLTGGRVKVKLTVGAMNARGGMLTGPPSSFHPDQLPGLAAQGYPRPIVAVRVANVGRQPVTVERWSLKHLSGLSFQPVAESIGKPLPHRLEVGQSEMWAMGLDVVIALAQAAQATSGSEPAREEPPRTPGEAFREGWRRAGRGDGGGAGIVAVVELADGRTKRSSEVIH